jgi:DNA-binding NarL/FixJ family response regulator
LDCACHSEADVSIVGEADDAAQALSLLDSLRPEVVLVDAETPDLDCASVVRSLAQHDPQLGIVVLSVHTAAVRHMLDGTPAHVVGKHERIPALVAAIHAAPRPRHSSEPGPREA